MASLKKCIEAKCKDCTYDPRAPGLGSWRQQVEDCLVRACPLWEVRPVTMETLNSRRKSANAAAGSSVDLDALVAGMEDETEDEVAA